MIGSLNLRWKFALANAAVVLLAIAITGFIALIQLSKDSAEQLQRSLHNKLTLVSELLSPELDGEHSATIAPRMRQLDAAVGARLTLITPDGRVIADSRRSARDMDNHGSRPEIMSATTQQRGTSRRYSHTVGYEMLYVAQTIIDDQGHSQGYIRVSYPLTDLHERQRALLTNILLAGLLGLAVAVVLGIYTAGRISRPLTAITEAAIAYREGDFSQRLDENNRGNDAFAVLSQAFNALAAELQKRLSIITDERNRLQAVLAALNEGVIAVDQDLRVLLMNQPAASLLDIPIPEHRISIRELCRNPEILSAFESVLQRGGRQQQVLTLYNRAQPNRPLSVDIHTATFGADSAPANGAVMVLHDISERRRLETMRRDFVANVSHELKTPLAAIRGLVETVLDDPDMPADVRQRFIGKVSEQCLRLSSIVMDLLTLSRAEVRGEATDSDVIDMASVIRQSSRQFDTPASEKNITLRHPAESAPLWVRGDPELLRQAVDNLIDNAIKYTPAGGWVRVQIDLLDDFLQCSVSDSGIGIASAYVDRIWERFYRVDKARSREVGGTGLGLSIVRNVIHGHGGQVAVLSEAGRGTTFRFTLPLLQDPDGQGQQNQ